MSETRKRLVALDLDGTLTQHRSPLDEEHIKLLDSLAERYKIIMVGAGNCPRIYKQMGEYPIDIIGNYGMQESRIEGGAFKIIRDDKVLPDREFFREKTDYLREKYGYTEYRGEALEFHDSGMVTFPLLGTKADIADKIAFDPDRSRRHVLYPEVLEIFRGYEVYVGGSSSFDFAPSGYNKYDALVRYGNEHGYSVDEMVYVGDDFGDGGGDSHIRIKGMDYVQIYDYRESPEKLKFLL